MRSTLLIAILALAGCEAATRSLGPAPEPPKLYAIERQVRDGEIRIPTGPADVTSRVALVIGNEAYQAVSPLDNPGEDARAMAALLRENGFRVIELYDGGKRAFEGALRSLAIEGGPGTEALVFYAGHGFQIGRTNYLVPVDAKLTGADDLPFQTVRLETLFKLIGARSQRHLSFLDSCRNNPFPAAEVKASIGPAVSRPALGFGEPSVPGDGLVAYSTAPGALAFDGEGRHSPFTEALLASARARPQAPVTRTLGEVKRAVTRATSGEQVPTWTSKLRQPVALALARIEPARITTAEARGPVEAQAIAANVAPGTSAVPAPRPASVRIEAPREKVVALGGRIAEALAVPETAKLTVTGRTGHGSLATAAPSGALIDKAEASVGGDSAGALVYRLGPEQQEAAAPAATETLAVTIQTPDAAPERVAVELVLVPDPCDLAASDWFDLQGTGLYRGDGAVASNAVAACTEAAKREPGNGRFRFQLGKALLVTGSTPAAKAALADAARLGHVRAEHLLGRIALAEDDRAAAAAAFGRGDAAGDPVSSAALGALLLEQAQTEAERDRAWELLSYAMDFGVPQAFDTLAGHMATPGADQDPDRAARFRAEADARRIFREQTGVGIDRPEIDGGGGDAGGGTGRN